MRRWTRTALITAGLVAFAGAAWADDARLPIGLTSFGAKQSLSTFALSPPGPAATFSVGDFSSNDMLSTRKDSFAASVALSSRLALDSGYNVDLTQRFDNFDAQKSPFLANTDFLGLANGGHYVGATWLASPSLSMRMGAAQRSNQLDRFSFDPALSRLGLPLAFDNGQSRTFLAGINWNMSDWGSVGLTAIQNSQSGVPFAADPLANLSASSRIDTNALDVAARFKLGSGWVTTASYAEGLTQTDEHTAPVADIRSYSIAIAKHGVFGDDAVGFSFSRPAASVLENGFDLVAASGDLPPLFVAGNRAPTQTPETDLQLGYVTQFMDGALALQANASYQMNYQGLNGANSVSVLSRAKIKF